MYLKVNYEYVKKNYPDVLTQLEAKRQKSKAKDAVQPLTKFNFVLACAEEVRGYAFDELVDGTAQKHAKTFEDMTLDEKVNHRVTNTHVFLEATSGRCRLSSDLLQPVPALVSDKYRELEEEGEKEKARISALTPEERDREMSEILGQLSGSSGFMCVNIASNPKD
jgi:5'-deoxynucleotidase YfbR-like HD superfamily hydrolase